MPGPSRRQRARHWSGTWSPVPGAGPSFFFSVRSGAQVASLPAEISPSRNLWPGIEARIGRPADRSTRLATRWGWLAAAAVILVSLSSAATAWFLRDRAPVAVTLPGGAGTASVTEATYLQAVDDLTAALNERRPKLNPQTLAVVERNLRIIDEAIQETREALARDPGNQAITELLRASYQRKIDLLQRAADNAES